MSARWTISVLAVEMSRPDSTMVVDNRMVKVLAWYDNEYGYAFRMADLAAKVAASLVS